MTTPAALRPRQPLWVPGVAAVGSAAALLGVLLVAGFVAVGLHAGPVAWGRLLGTTTWYPTGALFGAGAMLYGTAVVSVVALGLAVPVGWSAAVGLHEHLPSSTGRWLRSAVELLAAVPSIVYGLVGIAVVRPFVAAVGDVPGGDSLLAAGLVLAVMVLPTVVAVSIDALAAVPEQVREAAAALGLTRTEVVRSAVLPLARRGMRGAVLLALARALGETIAVFLVIGRADRGVPGPSHLLASLFEPGQTLTTKLGGPEPVLASAVGPQRAALCALALLLLVTVATVTALGAGRRGAVAATRRTHRGSARRGRVARDRLVRGLRWASVGLPVLLVLGILGLLAVRGHVAVHPSFWTTAAVGADGGGVRDQLLGTLVLVAATAALSLPLGAGLGLLLAEYAPVRLRHGARTAVLTLGGVPTIVLGLAGYAVFSLALGWGKSWVAGVLVLSVVVVPVVAVSTATRLDALDPDRRAAAAALGLTRSQLVRAVLLPYARPAVLTGLLLGLARAAGETAPLLFTATVFAGASSLPHGVVRAPVESLPTHIFTLAQDASQASAVDAAWGSGLVLVVLIGALLLGALPLRRRLEQP